MNIFNALFGSDTSAAEIEETTIPNYTVNLDGAPFLPNSPVDVNGNFLGCTDDNIISGSSNDICIDTSSGFDDSFSSCDSSFDDSMDCGMGCGVDDW